MATLGSIFTFIPNTTIDPSEVNSNFTTLINFLNTQVAQLDGPTFTGIPVLPATDPTSTLHVASKGYTDAAIAAAVASRPIIDKGTYQGTTTSGGLVTVSHTLGVNVAGAIAGMNGNVTLFGGAAVEGKVISGDAASVTFKFWNGTNVYASAAIKFHWIAW